MDIAYDHIQEEALTPEEAARKTAENEKERQKNLNTEFQEAYKSFTSSPWGARLGGFFNDVKKQGTSFYDEARQEASAAGGEAFKGFTNLRETVVGHARSMSGGATQEEPATPRASVDQGKEGAERSASEALRESESVISRFRSEAGKRLKDLEKAEEAADAAIFKFGANIGNFLKEAVTIAPPTEEQKQSGKILFESKDQDGKRVIHSTRLEAQLHAIHANTESFKKDPESADYDKWKADFDVEKKTDAIAKDLDQHEGLRRTMEKLVPEQVEYPVFWRRYYFLRMVVETEEERRKEILKGLPPCFNRRAYMSNSLQALRKPPPTIQYPGTTTPTTTTNSPPPLNKNPVISVQPPPAPHPPRPSSPPKTANPPPPPPPPQRPPTQIPTSNPPNRAVPKTSTPNQTATRATIWSVAPRVERQAALKKLKAKAGMTRMKRIGNKNYTFLEQSIHLYCLVLVSVRRMHLVSFHSWACKENGVLYWSWNGDWNRRFVYLWPFTHYYLSSFLPSFLPSN